MEPEGSKFIANKCITFNQPRKGRKSKDLNMKILETMKDKNKFEMEVLARDISSSEGIYTVASYYKPNSL